SIRRGGKIMYRILSAALAVAAALAAPARAETVKIVVPFAAGGPVDMVARLVGQELAPRINADVVIENRGGVGGALGAVLVVRSPLDGKTLVLASQRSFVINAVRRPPTSYDPLKAFTPITMVGAAPSLYIVRADYPAASLADFIARANQGTKMSYGSAGAV